MVDVGLMREPAALWTDVAAVATGFAVFGTFLLVPTFVQLPNGLSPEVAAAVERRVRGERGPWA